MSNIDTAKTYIKAVQTGDQATLGSIIRPMLFGTSPAITSFPRAPWHGCGRADAGQDDGNVEWNRSRSRVPTTTWPMATG